MNFDIRRATREDFAALQSIELAAFETLRAAGAVAGEPSASTDDELQLYLDAALLYAAFDGNGKAVGYGGGYIIDGWLHVGEIDVHPDWQRKGIGRRLMAALLQGGRGRRLFGATLTTDRFAPFNAPFYASLGFHIAEADACPPRLSAILEAEWQQGFDPLRRAAMVLIF